MEFSQRTHIVFRINVASLVQHQDAHVLVSIQSSKMKRSSLQLKREENIQLPKKKMIQNYWQRWLSIESGLPAKVRGKYRSTRLTKARGKYRSTRLTIGFLMKQSVAETNVFWRTWSKKKWTDKVFLVNNPFPRRTIHQVRAYISSRAAGPGKLFCSDSRAAYAARAGPRATLWLVSCNAAAPWLAVHRRALPEPSSGEGDWFWSSRSKYFK